MKKRFISRRGAALIIVLCSLVFLTALVLAFLASVGTELKATKKYSDGISSGLLAQSAYNLALAQIKEGTKGYPEDDQSKTLAWSSQPGMIRTYDTSGQPAGFYKLYSSDQMVVQSFPFDPASEVDAQWYDKKALYTDLNEPLTAGGTKVYPIVDGTLSSMTLPVAGNVKTYNSDSDTANPDIDGFYVKSAPVSTSATANQVPMPVKWLYILEDGGLVAPVTTGIAGEAKVSGASADNPIVGRIAFWTDDESAKININTASEGSYWDTPRVKSKSDDVFKVNQPVNGEYQRYPGHPAMTSLSTVIKYPLGWNPGTTPPTFTGGAASAVSFTLCTPAQWVDYQWAQKIYNLTPRIGTGGSFAGTVQSAMLLTGVTPPVINLDAERLYSGVDELIFKQDRTSNNQVLDNQVVLSKASLERAKFFLTAGSRAPDVNLFNQPRVCIWPLHATNTASYRTAFDRLIAFCTTVGGYSFYFERSNPNSPTADLALNRNSKLLTYLRTRAGQNTPGFGGEFSTKYGSDKDQIFTEIMDYIRCTNLRDPLLVDKTNEANSTTYTKGIPFSGWWVSAPAQATNGMGQVVPIEDTATSTRGFGRYTTLQGASVLFIGQVDGDGPLCPLDADNQPVATGPAAANTQADPVTGRPLPYWTATVGAVPGVLKVDKVAPNNMRIQAIFLPQFFCPAVGATWIRQNVKWSVDLSALKVNGNTLAFPSNSTAGVLKQYTMNQRPFDETGFGDQLGMNLPLQSAGSNIVSSAMDVPKGSMTFGGQVTVTIYAADAVAAPGVSTTVLQTIVLNFNGPSCSVPSLAWDHVANRQGNSPYNFDSTDHYLNYRSFINSTGMYNPANPKVPTTVNGGRLYAATNTRQAGGFIMAGDCIRSVRLISGDARLVAAQKNPPGSLFEANPTTADLLGAHSFLTGYGNSYYGAGLGKLVPGLSYVGSGITTANQNTTADSGQNVFFNNGYAYGSDGPLSGVEAGSSSSITGSGIPGDWDNGPFSVRDGAYINKADEGDVGGGGPAVSNLMEPYSWKLKAQSGGNINTSLFSPNRMIPSAVTFGSLPTGVKANKPWQTLLFRPAPGHPGSGSPVNTPVGPPYASPPDHLLLEFFTMPVVEPYAISEPLSTAGRINMNYQIVPFTYINRDTGIRALLKAEKVVAIRDGQAGVYKDYRYSTPTQENVRFDVNMEETLKGFQQRFTAKDIFRSASEICDLYIVPKDDALGTYPGSALDTYATMAGYWDTKRLTGDNSRERIYATLYPRLTTKSNTFTIYARVQSLKKIKSSAQDVWSESLDLVTGEYRGSQTVERYIDPNNKSLPDYVDPSVNTQISTFYKTRVVSSKQFAP